MQNAKEIDRLVVMKGDEAVGYLTRMANGYSMTFLPSWVGKPITYRIKGAATPLRHTGDSLPPYFANLLPEGYRLKALREKIKTSEDDLFSLLVASGGTCIGDLYVRSIDTSESEYSVQAVTEKTEKPLSPKKINFYDYFIRHAGGAMPESVPGEQEKISSSMISFPVNIAKKNKQYILKLNPKDKPHLVENEFACMTLAKKCKLNVAHVKLVSDRDRNLGLLVERFDRIWNPELQKFQMLHQEDGCQMLDLYPSQKYRVSWNALTAALAELTHGSVIDVLNALKWYAFSYLIGNGDLHAKNISLYDVPGSPRSLTPAYDLICTRIYGDERMALKLNGKDQNLTRKMLIELGQQYGVPAISVHQMLDKMMGLFQRNQSILFSMPMNAKQSKLLKTMVEERLEDLSP